MTPNSHESAEASSQAASHNLVLGHATAADFPDDGSLCANDKEAKISLGAFAYEGGKSQHRELPLEHETVDNGSQVVAASNQGRARIEVHVRFWDLTYTLVSRLHGRPRFSQWCGKSAFFRSCPPPAEITPKRRWRATRRQILFGLSGHFAPREMVGILGPSGAGKSTLLSILGGRVRAGLGGRIEVNGEPMTSRMKKVTGYVTQQEFFFTNLTVEETLTYTARLRLGRNVTWAGKKARVDEVIAAMKLGKCRHVRVGTPHARGLSGGELKRLNIANELLLDPAFFLLDEPTSGLDASISADLLDLLKKMTRANRCTTVCSIHQPSSDVFMSFDRVLFLRDGHIVYQGSPSRIGAYFSSLNFHCPEGWNVAEYVMKIVTATSVENRKYEKHNVNKNTFEPLEGKLKTEVDTTNDNHLIRGETAIISMPGALATSNVKNHTGAFTHICSEKDGTDPTATGGCNYKGAARARVGVSIMGEDVLLDAYKNRLDPTTFELRLSETVPSQRSVDSASTQRDRSRASKDEFSASKTDVRLATTHPRGLGRRFGNRLRSPFKVKDKQLSAPPGYFQQLWVLICRGIDKELKGKSMLFDVLQGIFIGVLLGCLYYRKLTIYSEEQLTERMGLLYFTTAYHTFGPAYTALNAFPAERNVIAKERSSEAYSLSCYLTAKTVSDLCIQVIAPTVWLCLLYPLAGLPAGIKNFVAFWAQLMLLVATSQAVGQLVAVIVVEDARLGGLMLSVLLIAASTSSGFYVSQHRLEPWISWMRWLSFQNYTITNLIHITIGSKSLSCAQYSSYPSCPQNPITAAMVIDRYTTALSPFWNVSITILMWLILKVFSYGAMKNSLILKV